MKFLRIVILLLACVLGNEVSNASTTIGPDKIPVGPDMCTWDIYFNGVHYFNTSQFYDRSRDVDFYKAYNYKSLPEDGVLEIMGSWDYTMDPYHKSEYNACVWMICAKVFKDCHSITALTLPQNEEYFQRIEDSAFENCTGLTSLVLPGSMKICGSSAFKNCTSLKTIRFEGFNWKTLPEFYTDIDYNDEPQYNLEAHCFSGCTSLETITSLATIPPKAAPTTFDAQTYSNATLIVPKGCASIYKETLPWSNFVHVEEANLSGVEEIAADGSLTFDIYSLSGVKLVSGAESNGTLAPGIYVKRYSHGRAEKFVVR